MQANTLPKACLQASPGKDSQALPGLRSRVSLFYEAGRIAGQSQIMPHVCRCSPVFQQLVSAGCNVEWIQQPA